MTVPERGFTYVEVLIAIAILFAATSTLLQVTASGQRLTRSQGEATDLHQRTRVGVERLRDDLALAGTGTLVGSLTGHFAPLVPARTGIRFPDPPLSAFADRVSIVYVAEGAWPSPLTVDMTNALEPVPISATAPGCPLTGLCGFSEGTRALLLDTRGVGAGHDLFTVTGVAGALAHDSPNPPLHRSYEAGTSIVVPVVHRVYHFDRAGRRLMVYDGYQGDMPLVDHLVDLRFRYFVDRLPSSVSRPADGIATCVYDAGSPAVPRLEDLGGVGLHELTSTQMTDGPFCGAGPGTFDGDLLRIRLVRVTMRLEAAADDVRGSGFLFARPGRSSSGESFVPDYEVTFDVAPRNMLPALSPR
jgi:hypothetical protein